MRWLSGNAFRGARADKTPSAERVGRWGERCAAEYVRRKGCAILGRRVKVGRRDEIDLLLRDGDTLVFAEVKTRRTEDYGSPASFVNRGKRAAQSRAAIRYVKKLKQLPEFIRFDIIEVIGRPEAGPPVIRHIENAFPLRPPYRYPG
jgi:putative endonuclease